MADTLGSLIDKLCTVDLKMWNNQEILYEIRRLTFKEFQVKYLSKEKDQKIFYETIKKCCDLNYQRSQLIDEIDQTFVKALKNEIKTDPESPFLGSFNRSSATKGLTLIDKEASK